jgi:hypothetical protein
VAPPSSEIAYDTLPLTNNTIDVLPFAAAITNGFAINAESTNEQRGLNIADAGDVNGDGLADLIVSSPLNDPSEDKDAWRDSVLFSKASTKSIDFSSIAASISGGFAISGGSTNEQSYYNIAEAGDVDGDGLADLIVSPPLSDPSEDTHGWGAYVVFGKASTIDLSSMAPGIGGGFAISGGSHGDKSISPVAGEGDVNGAGLADLIVSPPLSDPSEDTHGWGAYVVFGKASTNSSRPSGACALFWLWGGSAALWIPLLLADAQPWTSTATAPSPLAAPAAGPTAASRAARPLSSAASLPPPPTLVARLGKTPAPLTARASPRLESARARPLASRIAPMPFQRVKTAKSKAHATPTFAPAPSRQQPLPGSLLLGGPLTLASLHEKAMVPAARIEQVLRSSSADQLAAVPRHWRPTMAALIQGNNQILPAEVVRIPVPHLQRPEEYPMVVQSDGVAQTPVTPSELSRQALERWAERQSPTPKGSVRPVMVVLEPLAARLRTNGLVSQGQIPQ